MFRKPECAEWSKSERECPSETLRKRLLRRYRRRQIWPPCWNLPLFPSPSPPPRTGPRWRNAEFRFLVQSARYAKKVATFILPSRRNETCREPACGFYSADFNLFRGRTRLPNSSEIFPISRLIFHSHSGAINSVPILSHRKLIRHRFWERYQRQMWNVSSVRKFLRTLTFNPQLSLVNSRALIPSTLSFQASTFVSQLFNPSLSALNSQRVLILRINVVTPKKCSCWPY